MFDRPAAGHDQVGDYTEDGHRPHHPELTQGQPLPQRMKSSVELMYSTERSVAGSQLTNIGGAITKPWPRCARPSSSFRTVNRRDLTGPASSASDHQACGGNPVTIPKTSQRLARYVVESKNGVERVPVELQGGPAVAAGAAFPELAVGETGKYAALGSNQCVRHRRQGLG